MSRQVYLTIDISVTTVQEETPVSIRIQVSSATVKALHTRLQQAYLKDDVRLVRRTTVLIDLLVHHIPMAALAARWGLSASCLYDWQQFPEEPKLRYSARYPVYLCVNIHAIICPSSAPWRSLYVGGGKGDTGSRSAQTSVR